MYLRSTVLVLPVLNPPPLLCASAGDDPHVQLPELLESVHDLHVHPLQLRVHHTHDEVRKSYHAGTNERAQAIFRRHGCPRWSQRDHANLRINLPRRIAHHPLESGGKPISSVSCFCSTVLCLFVCLS